MIWQLRSRSILAIGATAAAAAAAAAVAACSILHPGSDYDDGTGIPLTPTSNPDPSSIGDGGAAQAPTCTDRAKNGDETDVDCGGKSCGKCKVASRCSKAEDCTSNVCVSGSCVDPTCSDGTRAGLETAIDCGGPNCASCDVGKACAVATDCKSAFCKDLICRTAISCKELKANATQLVDGFFTIDPDGDVGANPNAPFEVFCDMTTDGGGWTFFAHVNQNYVSGNLFEVDKGSYRSDRADDDTTYGRGGSIVQVLKHTQMMVTIDDAIPASASTKNKILFYEYAEGHEGFNKGPIPCKALSTGFKYRAGLIGAYGTNGGTAACNASNWFSFATNEGYLVSFSGLGAGYQGNHWGAIVGRPNGGTNTWGHDGYWYVR